MVDRTHTVDLHSNPSALGPRFNDLVPGSAPVTLTLDYRGHDPFILF